MTAILPQCSAPALIENPTTYAADTKDKGQSIGLDEQTHFEISICSQALLLTYPTQSVSYLVGDDHM